MSDYSYDQDTFRRLYRIGGSELALRYAEISRESSLSHDAAGDSQYELDVLDLQFYVDAPDDASGSEKVYASSFRRGSTGYVYVQIHMRNPWKHVSFDYDLLIRFYKPDGSLMGEVEDKIHTNPEWETFWHTRGWGWEKAGNWPPGTYRVEVIIDGEERSSSEFTIYEEQKQDLFNDQSLSWFRNRESLFGESNNLFSSDFSTAFGFGLGNTTQQVSPQPEEQPLQLGYQGWLNKIEQMFPADTGVEDHVSDQPRDDVAKLRRLMAIDGRYMSAMMRVQPGLANTTVLQDLKAIASDYETLLEAGPPVTQLYREEDLRTKIADTFSLTGRLCEFLRDFPEAARQYTAAADMYASLGNEEQLQRCRANVSALKFSQHGDVDSEIRRLRSTLETLSPGSVDYAEALIELASHYSSNDDDVEARQLLLQAETVLDRTGDPSGRDLGSALTQSLLTMMNEENPAGPLPLVEMMRVNGLYGELYSGLARIYQSIDPAKAADYREKALRRDSRETNDEFSEFMRDALQGDLGNL